MELANTNKLRPLTKQEIGRLEKALGNPIEQGYLSYWVSRAIEAFIVLMTLPTARERRDDLKEMADQGRRWIDTIEQSRSTPLLPPALDVEQLISSVRTFCELVELLARQIDQAVGPGHRARSASLASLLQSIDRKHHHPPNSARQTRGRKPADRQLEVVPLARLSAFKRNARTHSSKQVRQIAESVKRFGFIVPVLINAENQIVAGHGRVQAAKLLGLAEVPVLRVSHLSPVEQRAFVIADNRLAELAGWDRDALAIELQSLIEIEFAIDVIGFEVGEIDLILQ